MFFFLAKISWTDTSFSAMELCNSFRVTFGLFVNSLTNAILAWSVSFVGLPILVDLGFFGASFKQFGLFCVFLLYIIQTYIH